MELLAQGRTNEQIAADLDQSSREVLIALESMFGQLSRTKGAMDIVEALRDLTVGPTRPS
jgi:DNA-binding NarL/FixJ family response regulator